MDDRTEWTAPRRRTARLVAIIASTGILAAGLVFIRLFKRPTIDHSIAQEFSIEIDDSMSEIQFDVVYHTDATTLRTVYVLMHQSDPGFDKLLDNFRGGGEDTGSTQLFLSHVPRSFFEDSDGTPPWIQDFGRGEYEEYEEYEVRRRQMKGSIYLMRLDNRTCLIYHGF